MSDGSLALASRKASRTMLAKITILCAALAAVNAGVLHGVALAHTGVSTSARNQDAHGNYNFGYNIVDGHGASNSRHESGDGHGNKVGSYTLHDTDGRARRVDYVADGHGFRAAVRTNEPGTAQSAPAAAVIASPYAAPVAPVVAHAAPVAHAATIAHGGMWNAGLAHGGLLNAGLAHGGLVGAGHLGGLLGLGNAGMLGHGVLAHGGLWH